jgi:hypothetical protein
MKQRYELSKQLQDLHVDVALFSAAHLKPQERFFQITTFIEKTANREEKAELPLRLVEAFPIAMYTYHPLFRKKRRWSE